MDPRRGPPLLGGNRWASGDVYHLGSSSGDGGPNSVNTRIRFEDPGESSAGMTICHQETGKGPESSRPPVRKPSQVSPKLVAARSSGSRRVQRSHQGTIQGQWSALHGFVDGLNEAGSESMGIDDDGHLGMGLSTHLGISEEIIVHPAHVQSLPNSEFMGRTDQSGLNTLDFLSGRSSMQASGVPAYFGGRTGEHIGENKNVRIGSSELPSIGTRQLEASAGGWFSGGTNSLEERTVDGSGNAVFNSLFMDRHDMADNARNAMDERRGENGIGSMMANSLFMDRSDYRDDAQAQGSINNLIGATEVYLPAGSISEALVDESVGCSNDNRQYSVGRHSLFGGAGGNPLESSSGSNIHMGSSSRSSACKRKSCTPGVPGNMSCRISSPHRTGHRDGYSGRTEGRYGLSWRTSSIGGSSSAPESVGPSSSPSDAVYLGRHVEPFTMSSGLDEPRWSNFLREPTESSREGRYGKSVAGSSNETTNSQRITRSGTSGVVLNNPGANNSPFTRALRRAAPSHDNLLRRPSVPDTSMDADVGVSNSSLLEHMLSGNQSRRGDSPQLVGGRVGGSGSPRRSEAPFGTSSAGDRVIQRYLGNSSRGLLNSGPSGSPVGGTAASEGRLRSRVLSHHSEQMSQSSPPASQPVSLTMQTALHAASPSAPSTSRPPPHPPSLRGRLQGSSLQSLLPPPSPSGPAPSRLPPSPSSLNPLSFSPSTDSLPSPSNLFRGSLLHGAFPSGLRERGFVSAEGSLLGMPFRGLQMSAVEGGPQPRLMAEGLAEILFALERVERDEDLTYEQLLMLEATLLFGGMGLHDQHSDLRLDVDNMSYEELLALEERIGNVSTGVSSEAMAQKLKKTRYSSLDAVVARYSQESDIKCSICQEEYEEGDELGKIECGHGYHSQCIQQWLVQKNQCPICKATALA